MAWCLFSTKLNIIWTNAGLLSIEMLTNKFWWNLNQNKRIFIEENVIETVICKMAAILSQP